MIIKQLAGYIKNNKNNRYWKMDHLKNFGFKIFRNWRTL